jgi:hypothetical protein
MPTMLRLAARLLALSAVTAAPLQAQQGCAGAIVEFRSIVETESQMGHASGSAKRQLQGELARIEETCHAGRNADAMRALEALRSRYGYR